MWIYKKEIGMTIDKTKYMLTSININRIRKKLISYLYEWVQRN